MISLSGHLEGLREAMVSFVRSAERAGLAAPVPTTPDWTVRQLVAHQGMVHRWSAAMVRGEEVAPAVWDQEGQAAADPLEWLRDGAIEVVSTIVAAPADLEALVFLADAPPARPFWARRQCHETTIHAVDALSAELGRYPVAADAGWIGADLALDGIDELLTGFLPRRFSRLRSEQPRRIVVRPEEGERSWLVELGEEAPVTTRLDGPAEAEGDVLLEGSAAALYLTLWNRSDEVVPSGDWDLWREGAQVRWSR